MTTTEQVTRLKNILYMVKRGHFKSAEKMLQKQIDRLCQEKFEKQLQRRTVQGGLFNPR